jgi:hypothetical protein
MAKSDLLNSPNSSSNLTGESSELDRLFKKYPRSTTGNIVFVSSTSGTTYDMATYLSGLYNNQGEQGMLLLLQSVLANYMINASDFNNKVEQSVFNSHTAENATDHDIIRLAKTSTGTADALVIDTAGTFDLTKDGNVLHVVPNLTNTGAVTVTVDGQTKTVKEFNVDTDVYIDLVAGDLKKNTPAQLVWSVGSDFFILRPSGGANKDSITQYLNDTYYTSRAVTGYTQRLSVSGKGWVIGLSNANNSTADQVTVIIDGVSKTIILPTKGAVYLMIRYESSFILQSNSNYAACAYTVDGIDKSIEKGTLNIYSPVTTPAATTTVLDVTGEGMLFMVGGDNNAITTADIIIDGVSIMLDKGIGGMLCLNMTFKSSLLVKSDGSIVISYALK